MRRLFLKLFGTSILGLLVAPYKLLYSQTKKIIELINCGKGGLFGPGNAKLPLPPMLMFDRITEISEDKGAFKKLNDRNN